MSDRVGVDVSGEGPNRAQAFAFVELFASLGHGLTGLRKAGFVISAPPPMLDAMRQSNHPDANFVLAQLQSHQLHYGKSNP